MILVGRVLRPPPPPAAILISDTVNNLRAALDHALWELTIRATRPPPDPLPHEWRRVGWPVVLKSTRPTGSTSGGRGATRFPGFDQVVAPKQPLILGGSDEIAEMELSPLVVAVSFGGQIWEQVKDLPPGTRIGGGGFSVRP